MNNQIENAPRNLKLTEKGKNFIRTTCKGSGRYRLDGKMDKPLPSCSPQTPPSKIWYSSATWNDKKIIDDTMFGEALIDWFDEFANNYKIDPNVVAARIFLESQFCTWAYVTNPKASSSMGLGQFTNATTYDVFFSTGYRKYWTNDEIAAMTKNLINFTNVIDGKIVVVGEPENLYPEEETGRINRPFLFQNMVDNPKLCLKAAFIYMSVLADNLNGLASSTLLCYYLGGTGKIKCQTYTDTMKVQYSKKQYVKDESIVNNAIKSTSEAFTLLQKEFGYNLTNNYDSNTKTLAFDSFNINVIDSMQKKYS